MTRHVIGICGLIGHGKDTAAGFLIEEGFSQISFGEVVKDVLVVIFGWDREMLEGTTPESRAWRNEVDEWWAARLGIAHFTPRWALQNIGTNVMRNHFHEDIWVAAVEKRIEQMPGNIVISDCRFFNELDLIKRLDGVTVSVWRHERPEWWDIAVSTNTTPKDSEWLIYDEGNHMEVAYPDVHASEWSWAGWDFTHEIHNTTTLEEFKQKTLKLLR